MNQKIKIYDEKANLSLKHFKKGKKNAKILAALRLCVEKYLFAVESSIVLLVRSVPSPFKPYLGIGQIAFPGRKHLHGAGLEFGDFGLRVEGVYGE